MTIDEDYTTWPVRAYCERRSTSGVPLPAAATALANVLPGLLSVAPLAWDVGTIDEGHAAIPVVVDESTMSALLDRLRDHAIPCLLANRPRSWDLLLAIQESVVEAIQYANLSSPALARGQRGGAERLMRLVTEMGLTFGAHVAYVEDLALTDLYSGRRAAQRTLSGLPAEVLEALTPESIAELTDPPPLPGVAGSLPELLVPDEFDRERVPRAVYWINWWPVKMVATIGRENVLGADWAIVQEHDDGAMTLAATHDPPDLGRSEDLHRLTSIVERLDLRAIQDRLVVP